MGHDPNTQPAIQSQFTLQQCDAKEYLRPELQDRHQKASCSHWVARQRRAGGVTAILGPDWPPHPVDMNPIVDNEHPRAAMGDPRKHLHGQEQVIMVAQEVCAK